MKNALHVIALSGKAGSGKSTFAELLKGELENQFHLEVKTASFASSLKQEVASTFMVSDRSVLYDQERKKESLPDYVKNFAQELGIPQVENYRELMQAYGDFKRKDNPNYFSDILIERLKGFEASNVPCIIIDDLRYLNEIEVLRNSRFIVTIIRLEHCNPVKDQHRSETDLDSFNGWDYKFCPDYGKLKDCVDLFLKKFLEDASNKAKASQVEIKPINSIKKGELYQLAKPDNNSLAMTRIIYKVHKKREDGAVILKPFKQVG